MSDDVAAAGPQARWVYPLSEASAAVLRAQWPTLVAAGPSLKRAPEPERFQAAMYRAQAGLIRLHLAQGSLLAGREPWARRTLAWLEGGALA